MMKSMLSRAASSAAAAIVVLAGCVMAGLGFTVLAVLAMFALAALGLAVLVSPFLAMSRQNTDDRAFEMFQHKQSAG